MLRSLANVIEIYINGAYCDDLETLFIVLIKYIQYLFRDFIILNMYYKLLVCKHTWDSRRLMI